MHFQRKRPSSASVGGDAGLGVDDLAFLATSETPRSDEDLDECVAAWQEMGGAQRSYPHLQLPHTASGRSNRGSSGLHSAGQGHSRFSDLGLGLPLSNLSHGPAAGSTGVGLTQVGPVLSVNVGGEIYRSTASTLRKAPFFEEMLRGYSGTSDTLTVNPASSTLPNTLQGSVQGNPSGAVRSEDDRFFVDRSGEFFGYILDFLRSGHWLLGDHASDPEFIDALREEAAFYGLDTVQNRLPMPRIVEYVTVWQFREDVSLYVDCLEQTIREDPDHQGLFRLCKYSGGLPLDQQTCTKRFKATSHSVQSVIAYFAMRGFSLHHVVEGSMITHTTSADGQSRSGHGVQYILSRMAAIPGEWTPPNTQRG